MGFSISNLFTLFSRFGKLSDEIKTDKQWYLSKTIWFNLLSLLVWGLMAGWNIDIGASPEALAAVAAGIASIVNIVLRLITTKPVVLKK